MKCKTIVASWVLVLGFVAADRANAQVRYFVETSTETYVQRSGGLTLIEPAANDTSCLNRSVTLPFPFYFDGVTFYVARVSSAGFISFDTSSSSCESTNDNIPNTSTPDQFVAGFWDDIELAEVKTFVDGRAPRRRYVIQWRGAIRDPGTARSEGAVNFQITLFEEGLGHVRVHYGPYQADPAGTVQFNATTGFENDADDYGAYLLPCANSCTGADFAAQEGNIYDIRVDPTSVSVENYLVREFSEPYVPLANGTPMAMANPGSAASTLSIGFDFEFYRQITDSISVGVNGVARFIVPCTNNSICGGGGICNASGRCEYPGISGDSDPIPSLNSPGLLVAPYWADLVLDPTRSSIRTAVFGTTPNREIVVEWRDIAHAAAGGLPSVSTTNFQVRLFESTNQVRIHYGPFNSGPDNTVWNDGVLGMEDGQGLSGHRPSAACAVVGNCSAADLTSMSNTVVEFALPSTVELTALPSSTTLRTTGPTPLLATTTQVGAQLELSTRVENIGRLDAASFRVDAFLSIDQELDSSDILLGSEVGS